jgi:hypothetical protein
MCSDDDTGNWVPLTEAEQDGPERVITAEELDILDLVQNFGAVASDPLSIERARGRREVERPLAMERIMAAIRTAEVHVAYGRRDRKQRSDAGHGNRGRRAWHTEALDVLLGAILDSETTPGDAYFRFLRVADGQGLDELIDRLSKTGVLDIEHIRHTYPSRGGRAGLFTLVRAADRHIVTVNAWKKAVAKRPE